MKKQANWEQVRGITTTLSLEKTLDSMALHPYEVGGFMYGFTQNKQAYLSRFIHYMGSTTSDELRGQTFLSITGEEGQRFMDAHKRIMRKGKKKAESFVCVPYHTHPKVNLDILSDEEIKDHGLEGRTTMPSFDNTILSDPDIEFSKKFGSYGLTCLAVGTSGDPAEKSGLRLVYDFARKAFANLRTTRINNRSYFFQVSPSGNVVRLEKQVMEQQDDQAVRRAMADFIKKTNFIAEEGQALLTYSVMNSKAKKFIKAVFPVFRRAGLRKEAKFFDGIANRWK